MSASQQDLSNNNPKKNSMSGAFSPIFRKKPRTLGNGDGSEASSQSHSQSQYSPLGQQHVSFTGHGTTASGSGIAEGGGNGTGSATGTPIKRPPLPMPLHSPAHSNLSASASTSFLSSRSLMHQSKNPSSKSQQGNQYRRNPHKRASFNDPIHGIIEMDGLCLSIIDTKEFQRLRELKQLGTCDFVYPGATHSRFSHSLGVAHYAERFVLNLHRNQPELGITDADRLCVKVAGLCHDLGHGPFSHVFDGVFMTRMHPDKHWRHEDWSVNIFRHLLHRNHIDLLEYGLDSNDQLFIEEIIRGTKENERKGREFHKFYLYDIVNNSRSGLDVDKLDYFQRDIRHTNVFTSYDKFQRFLEFGRVMQAQPILHHHHNHHHHHSSHHHTKKKQTNPIGVTERNTRLNTSSGLISEQDSGKSLLSSSTGGVDFPYSPFAPSPSSEGERDVVEREPPGYMICYPEKMIGEAVQLFMLRYQLHQKVYTHKSVKKVEYMLVDALEKADPYILIPGTVTSSHPDGKYRMSECVEDPAALSNLTDNVVYVIETSTSDELAPARELIQRIRCRDFYTCLGKTVYKRGTKADRMSTDDIAQELLDIAKSLTNTSLTLPNSNAFNDSAIIEESDEDDERDGETERVQDSATGNRESDGAGDEDFDYYGIQSQDSFAPWVKSSIHDSFRKQKDKERESSSQGSVTSGRHNAPLTLDRHDVIVEKMHIHYGLKGENPVSRLRFFPKEVLTQGHSGGEEASHGFIATAMKESSYETLLPRVFEECALRVFCRDRAKNSLVAEAYKIWCREYNSSTPFPTLSQN